MSQGKIFYFLLPTIKGVPFNETRIPMLQTQLRLSTYYGRNEHKDYLVSKSSCVDKFGMRTFTDIPSHVRTDFFVFSGLHNLANEFPHC